MLAKIAATCWMASREAARERALALAEAGLIEVAAGLRGHPLSRRLISVFVTKKFQFGGLNSSHGSRARIR